jgi:hypothetical protein
LSEKARAIFSPKISEAQQELKAKIFSPFSLFELKFAESRRSLADRHLTPRRISSPPLQLEEFLLDTTLNFGPAPGGQEFADVSFDGTNYFVVWHDWENGNIYGARVRTDGILLDTFGIPICTDWAWQEYPAVAFDGTNYLVVWTDYRNWDADIYGARVTPAGIVLDPDGIPISTALYDQYLPSIEFDGTNYLVAWNDFRSGLEEPDIYAARITPQGVVLDPDGIAVSTAPYEQSIMLRGIGFDGTNYLLVWHDDRDGDYYYDVYGARVTRAGVVLDPDGFPISVAQNNQGFAQLSFDGTNYFVVWLDDRTVYEDYRIYGARVTPAGIVLDPNGIQITQNLSVYPAVAFDNTNYLVVWTDGRTGWEADIYGARVTPAGIVLDPQGIPISTAESDQWMSAIIFDGTRYFTTWSDYRNGNSDIYGARVTTAGNVLDPAGILLDYGYSSPEQSASAVSFDGTNYFVVWQDDRNGEADIYGARVTPSGIVLDPQGIPISIAPEQQESPQVTFDGINYLVVWQDGRNWEADIYGARVTPAGVVLDPDGIPISTAVDEQYSPSLCFGGTNYLVAWQDYRNGEADIYGARVNQAGNVLDPMGIAICNAIYDQYPPDVAFDGTNYLVVWDDGRNGDDYDIYGTRVTTAGVVLEPQGIPISTASDDQYFPQVAFDGSNYLVVFWDYRNVDWDVYGARVTPAGVVLEPQGIPISTAEADQNDPTLAFDGTNYLVVWTDYRNWDADIYGARVTPAGVVLDPQGIELINQPEARYDPSIAKGLDNQLLLTFTGYVPLFNAEKILGAFYPGVGITENISSPKINFRFSVYPNPIRKTGVIELSLPKQSEIKLSLFDVSGRLVKTIAAGKYPLGNHQIRIDAQTMKSGIYFLRLKTEGESSVIKITIL